MLGTEIGLKTVAASLIKAQLGMFHLYYLLKVTANALTILAVLEVWIGQWMTNTAGEDRRI